MGPHDGHLTGPHDGTSCIVGRSTPAHRGPAAVPWTHDLALATALASQARTPTTREPTYRRDSRGCFPEIGHLHTSGVLSVDFPAPTSPIQATTTRIGIRVGSYTRHFVTGTPPTPTQRRSKQRNRSHTPPDAWTPGLPHPATSTFIRLCLGHGTLDQPQVTLSLRLVTLGFRRHWNLSLTFRAPARGRHRIPSSTFRVPCAGNTGTPAPHSAPFQRNRSHTPPDAWTTGLSHYATGIFIALGLGHEHCAPRTHRDAPGSFPGIILHCRHSDTGAPTVRRTRIACHTPDIKHRLWTEDHSRSSRIHLGLPPHLPTLSASTSRYFDAATP